MRLSLLLLFALVSLGLAQEQPAPVRRGSGLLLSDANTLAAIPLADLPLMGPLPSRVDLSASFPKVGDQGQQGSCVGWAVAYALKSYQERKEIGWPFTEESTFSPAYIYNQARVGTCQGGAYYWVALNLLTSRGVAPMGAFPYDATRCDQPISDNIHLLAKPFRAAQWRRVNTLDASEIKTHLVNETPVLIGMRFDASFQRLREGIYTGITTEVLGGHAMVIVGYDDEKGAFRVINSWGESWGEKGFGWVAYGAASSLTSRAITEGYVVVDGTTAPRPVPGEPLAASVGSAPPAQPDATINIEKEFRSAQVFGARTVTRGTGNHHCSSNCEGEPTRTNYTLTMEANGGRTLRNPVLACVAGSCPWSAVLFVRIEAGGRRAVASWDVWSKPTTWVLTAEEIGERDTGRMTEVINATHPIVVKSKDTDLPPRLRVTLPDGRTVVFIAGDPSPDPSLEFVGRSESGGIRQFNYRYMSGRSR